MRRKKEQEYSQLNRRLSTYVMNTSSAIRINHGVKNRIWSELQHEIHQRTLKRSFTRRKVRRMAFALSLLMALWVGIDLTSEASLFRRLLMDVSGNHIVLYESGASIDGYYEDDRLYSDVTAINEEVNLSYVIPVIDDGYNYTKTVLKNDTLNIYLNSKDGNNSIRIRQQYIKNSGRTQAEYDSDYFDVENFLHNGVEYAVLKGEKMTMVFLVIGDIGLRVSGIDYNDVVSQALIIAN